MKILHIFDGYGNPRERALPGEGSVPSIVYHLAKHSVQLGQKVTILERDHDYLPKEEIYQGIQYFRIKARALSAPPYTLIRTSHGFLKLFSDGIKIARKINRFVRDHKFDVVHTHFPFAVNVMITLNKKIRRK